MSLLLAMLLSSAWAEGILLPRTAEVTELFGERVAMVVGVNSYQDATIGNLQYAEDDALDMYAVLSDPTFGGFDEVHPFPGQLTVDAFWKSFDAVTSDLQPDDTFLLQFSGHGTLRLDPDTGKSRLYLLLTDSVLSDPARTAIDLEELEAALKKLKARRRVLIIDACHSETTGRSALSVGIQTLLGGLKGPPPPPHRLAPSDAEIRLYASDYYRPAIELDDLENGVYSHYFVAALRGGLDLDHDGIIEVGPTVEESESPDLNGDGLIEAVEAHDWATNQTIQKTGGVQVPRHQIISVGREEIYLSGPRELRIQTEGKLVPIRNLPVGAILEIDGQERGPSPVSEGWRQVTVRPLGGRAVRGWVRFREGHPFDVQDFIDDQEPIWLAAGGAWALVDADRGIGPTTGASLEGRLQRGTRVCGVRTTQAIGQPVSGSILDHVRTAEFSIGRLWGNGLTAGPEIGAGALWRTFGNDRTSEATATLMAGARAQVMWSWGFAAISPRIEAVIVTDEMSQFVYRPGVTVSAGFRAPN